MMYTGIQNERKHMLHEHVIITCLEEKKKDGAYLASPVKDK